MTLQKLGVVACLVAGTLVGCTGSSSDTATTTTTASASTTGAVTTATAPTTTAAPTTTTTQEPHSYNHAIPVGENGIEYRDGGNDLETVGPTYVAATAGTVLFADPVGERLWVLDGEETRTIDLAALDILNVTALAANAESVYVVEVLFAPARQRLHQLTLGGDLVSTIDLASGAKLEDGLSGVLIDDTGEPVIVLAGGALYANPLSGESQASLTVAGRELTQIGPDVEINGTRVSADLIGEFGGLRVLGAGGDRVVLVREEVVSMSPIQVLVTVEWYGAAGFAGSALVPLDGQVIPAPPGLAVSDDGRVVMLIAGIDAVEITELTPTPERITASTHRG